MTALAMPSNMEIPDVKKQLSARVRGSIHAKIGHIRELWQEAARLRGASPEAVDAIDTTHVIETLLGAAVDGELAQWGGFPTTPEAKAEQMKTLRAASKKHS